MSTSSSKYRWDRGWFSEQGAGREGGWRSWWGWWCPLSSGVIKNGLLENGPCIDDFPIKTSILRRFSSQPCLITGEWVPCHCRCDAVTLTGRWVQRTTDPLTKAPATGSSDHILKNVPLYIIIYIYIIYIYNMYIIYYIAYVYNIQYVWIYTFTVYYIS